MKYFFSVIVLFLAYTSISLAQNKDKYTLLLEINNISKEAAYKEPIFQDAYTKERLVSYLNKNVLLISDEKGYELLKKKGYEVKKLMEDENQTQLYKRAIFGESMKLSPVYHSYNRIIKETDDLIKNHPDLIQRFSIGKTTQEKRDIFAVKISENVNKKFDKPAILLNGCHHSNELLGAEICMEAMHYLVSNYNRDKSVTEWINNYDIFIIPVVNVDGHNVVTMSIDPNWRKNTRDNNNNGILDDSDGVDLNRNYDYNWMHGGTNFNSSERFRGEYPFSESENRAVRNLVEQNHFLLSITYHSSGEVIFYPWEWKGRKAPDDTLLTKLANGLASNIKTMSGDSTYKAYYGAGTVGQTYNWLYARFGTFDFVIETASGAQIVPPEMVQGIVNENMKGVKYIFEAAKGPGLTGHITDEDTGEPLQAIIWLPAIETEELSRRISDKTFGRFWRLLSPNHYTVIISKEGYQSKVIKNIKVNNNGWTTLDVKLKKN